MRKIHGSCTPGHRAQSTCSAQRQKAFHAARVALITLLMAMPFIAQARIPARAHWTLRFGDDFNGPAGQLPSRKLWRFDTGHRYPGGPPRWGTHEIQAYTRDPANVSLDGNGHLRITPRKDPAGHWTSARIETRQADFKPPTHGVLRIQARIRMPDVDGRSALGYWPAFWALGGDYRISGNWPQIGEFDIMENVNGLDRVWGTLHCGIDPGGPCGEPSGLGKRMRCPQTACQSHFHTYTLEWDRSSRPQQLRWYVDGQLYNHIAQNRLPSDTWKEVTGHGGYFLLLDVAIGGDFSYAMSGGTPTPTPATKPGHPMVVDYVAVWTRPAQKTWKKDKTAAVESKHPGPDNALRSK